MDHPDLGRVALFGAGGAVGHSLALLLAQRSRDYRVVGRNPEHLAAEFPGADIVPADFLTGENIDQAARDIDTIFYLAGAPYTHFEQHPIMTRNALAAASASGVSRFVHIAPVYSYGRSRVQPVSESQPHQPNTRKGRWRLEQEQAVLQNNGKGSLHTVIVHLPDFYGPHADNSIANYFMRDAAAGKTATFIGPLDAQREFVYVPDVAAPLLAVASDGGAYGRCWNLAGVAPIRARDFTMLVFDALSARPKLRAVPKIALQLFGVVNPFMRELAEMYYLNEGFILDDSALRARIGDIEKTPYAQGIRTTIDWMKSA
jgi:nucleoside-diphosphate-sugar epimerase